MQEREGEKLQGHLDNILLVSAATVVSLAHRMPKSEPGDQRTAC